MDTDRNLLFGILALQLEYVDSTQFTEACAAWAVAKQKTLAEILVQRGWMTPDDSTEVERLVARKIEQHAGDAHKTLILEATIDLSQSSGASAQIEAIIDSTGKSRGSADLQDTHSSMPPGSTPSGYAQMETLNYEAPEERSRYGCDLLSPKVYG
ncbi:MAG: hypothetical protein O3C40_32505 [Planctomycetota bacterium]|nr:hypothetical protein [Planctomycetota bacterium]